MNTLMSLHRMGSIEESPTRVTTIRFLSSMYSFMSHNKRGPHEEFGTETTIVQSPWFLDIGTGRLEGICIRRRGVATVHANGMDTPGFLIFKFYIINQIFKIFFYPTTSVILIE